MECKVFSILVILLKGLIVCSQEMPADFDPANLPAGMDVKALNPAVSQLPGGKTMTIDPKAAFMNRTTTMSAAQLDAIRFATTSPKVKKRTTPRRISLAEDCDYLAYYCLKAYKTGTLCARTIYYKYHDFANYCMMDYVNCMERYEVWQVVHMGDCFQFEELKDYQHYEYHDDSFLDSVYVIEE